MTKNLMAGVFGFFFALILMVAVVFGTRKEIRYNADSRQYARIIANACVDGMKDTNASLVDVFNTSQKRTRALKGFYSTVIKNFGDYDEVKIRQAPEKTPFVILVDNDGFYVSYNAAFDKYMTSYVDNAGSVLSDFDAEHISSVTSINTWSEEVGGDIVRFYLNDHVKVISSANKIYEGTRKEVALDCPYIACLQTKADFETEKRYVIIQSIEDEINFLLNSQPINDGKYYKAYEATLPQKTMEDWSRMLARPCIISFIQGTVDRVGEDTTNVFAYAGGEIIKSRVYYGEGDFYYREDSGTHERYGTMESLADEGYNPDITAMWEN